MMHDRSARWMSVGFVSVLVWVFTYWSWNPIEPDSAVVLDPLTDSATPDRTPDAEVTRRQPDPTPPAETVRPAQPERETTRERGGPTTRTPEPVAPAGNPPPAEAPAGVVAPAFRDYTIRPGDTFEGIARRELGSSRHAEAIQRANPLRDPRRIRPGDTIRLPLDVRNIQGKPEGAPDDANPADPDPVSFAEYVVVSGDTLSSIAQRLLGSTDRARAIYELNRDRLRSMDSIRVGQRLRIPAPPEPSGTP